MKKSEPLRDMLADLARIWTGDQVPIVFPGENRADGSFAPKQMATTPDEEIIVVPSVVDYYDIDRDLDYAHQLMLLADALHHEAEHVNQTALDEKADVADEHGQLAAHLQNVIEDQYINHTRTQRDRGMRRNLAYKADVAVMANAPDVSELDEAQRPLAAINQLAWGDKIKGYSELADDEQRLYAWCRKQLDRARSVDAQEGRTQIAVAMAERIADVMDVAELDTDPIPDWLKDLLDMLDSVPMPDGPMDGDAEGEGEGEGDADADADGEGAEPDDGPAPEDLPEPEDIEDLDDVDDADIEDLEDAEDTDRGITIGRHMGGDVNLDYDAPDRATQGRAQRLKAEERKVGTDLDEAKEKRRVIMDHYEVVAGGNWPADGALGLPKSSHRSEREVDPRNEREWPHQDVLARYDEDMAEDVADVFRQYGTAPTMQPSREGPRVNKRVAKRWAMGDYSDRRIKQRPDGRREHGDRVLGVACDFSGSMGGDTALEAKKAIKGLVDGAGYVGDDVIATTFQSTSFDGLADLTLVCGPGEDWRDEYLDAMVPGGAESPANGALWTSELMDQVGARERVLVMIHDGKPHIPLDDGTSDKAEAIEDTRRVVEQLREDGIKVIGMGVGDGVSEGTMADMFGEDAYVHVDTANFAEALTRIYEDQLDVSIGHRR